MRSVPRLQGLMVLAVGQIVLVVGAALLPWADNDITGAESARDVLTGAAPAVTAVLGLAFGVAVALEVVLAATASFGRLLARGWRVAGSAAAVCAVLAAVHCVVIVRSRTARAYMVDPAGNLFEPVATSRPGLGLLSATGFGLLLLAVHLASLMGSVRAHRG